LDRAAEAEGVKVTVRSHRGGVVNLPDLVIRLREYAGGICAYRAAVELLVDHGVFLGRSAFCDEFVRFTPAGAYVRWGAVVTALNQYRLSCSTSEAGIARIAASLGGDVPVRLGRVLGGFDAANVGRVLDAVCVANHGRPHRCRDAGGEMGVR
jgi:hypothetical protein